MAAPKPKRIRKIEYDRIDRVGDGAQPGAHVTLVKARPVRISKLIDPASIDARVQRVRDEFRELYSPDNYGCCSPCSGYVYVDAVYDGMVIACDSDGTYWQFSYTQDAAGDVTFGAPEAVKPSVKWSAASGDDVAPMPVMKSKALWEAPAAERIQRRKTPITKEQSMPDPITPDLSALDETTRTAVEAAITERESLLADKAAFDAAVAAAAVAEAPEPEVDDDELESIEGIQAAIAKSRSPEMKRVLKATLSRMQKAETQAAADREVSTRLMKAERVRIFKERAAAVGHIAPHADGIEGLAGLLAEVDEHCGAETCEKLEKALGKANTQIAEFVKPLLKSVGRQGGTGEGFAVITGTTDDPAAPIAEHVAALKKSMPELTDAQAMTRVLREHPDLYTQAIAR